ncbi:type II 3-dehydroquinate dehydratase [Candidatus Pseudothioglobus sp. Uisw_086]|jgi:3-dehydroquinate dehydratase-2|uniref:type II 3-dehydroquinate dehydratase n=1 Tax=Candidatus Pseudothioglobus sp. Uisw_086 TaxID=3230998 RepID=UPI003A836D23
MNIYVINGPNINLLGTREPEIYGSETLGDIEKKCIEQGLKDSHSVKFMQSNYEGEIVEWIQHAIIQKVDVIIINAAAYTHTSIAIHDALKSYSGYKIELHISNPHLRESFRHVSFISSAVDAVVAGLGADGYCHVIDLLSDLPIKIN